MVEKLLRENLKDIVPYKVEKRTLGVFLDANENAIMPSRIKGEIAEAVMSLDINRYPDSDVSTLRKILASNLLVNMEEVIVGSGSDQLIYMILQAFIDYGDKIATVSPTFSMYGLSNKIVGGKTIEVRMDEGFKFNYHQFIKVVKKQNPKVIFIANPNNPTGGIVEREHLIKIIEYTNAVVVVDEAYYEFHNKTVIDLVKYYPNLIVLRTLSKAMGLAGARIGYAVASKAIIRLLNKVKPPYNISSLDEAAAVVCIKNQDIYRKAVKEIIIERDNMIKELESLGEVEVFRSYGNFVLFRTKHKNLYNSLMAQNIYIRSFKEEELKDCYRVTIGASYENNAFIIATQSFFNG